MYNLSQILWEYLQLQQTSAISHLEKAFYRPDQWDIQLSNMSSYIKCYSTQIL